MHKNHPNRTPNRLIHCTSPYLQQHAYNPVDWYPWSEEALQRAKTEQKLIFLSIGYASCHWCHVMERESFEDTDVAAYLNQHFIPIKVDREERPDLDAIYMEAVQLMTGSGGWPLNIFLTPSLHPVFGGTYFPPEPNHRLPSFRMVLERLVAIATETPDKIERQGASLKEALQQDIVQALREKPRAGVPVRTSAVQLLQQMDRKLGGFGSAPKFPNTMALQFLLLAAQVHNEPQWASLASFSVKQMLFGGIYDQIGGGLARYSTDNRWLVPHFEKMLYDQALLLKTMVSCLRTEDDATIYRRLHQTLDFLDREMLTKDGAYASAIDADSEGVEGKFYTFTLDEARQAINDETLFETAKRYFGLSVHGNWEETHVLEVLDRSLENNPRYVADLEQIRSRLLEARSKRERPITDTKTLLGWNALLLDAFCDVAAFTGETNDVVRVKNLASALEKNHFAENCWYRVFHQNQRAIPAFLDDLSLAGAAFLRVFELTGNLKWFEASKRIGDEVLSGFYDGDGGFFMVRKGSEETPFQTRDLYDNAYPGSTGSAIALMYALWRHSGETRFGEACKKCLNVVGNMASEYPLSFGNLMQTVLAQQADVLERVYIGNDAERAAIAYRKTAAPFTIVLLAKTETEAHALLAGKHRPDLTGTWYWECRNFTCSLPVRVG